jgi:outer membrane protein
LKIDLSTRKQLLQESEAKLAITLGLQPTTSVKVQPINITAAPKKELLDQLISCANEHRADLQEKQARYAAALCEVQKERAAAWPEFSVFGREGLEKTHHKTKDETCHSVHQNSKSRQYDVGIKVEVPLFTGFELMHKKRAAMAEANLSKAEIIELQLDIARDVAIATYSLESAQEKLPYAQDNLESATKAYRCSFDRYMAGRAEIAELYNAQQQVASARIQYGTVKTQWLTAIANLAYATGTIR